MKQAAGRCLAGTGFTFLFAPHYHPAMKNIAPVRAALGVRTVFNILGPLSNPAEPEFHVIGAFDLATAELMANALIRHEHPKRAFVIHGAAGWDEPTPIGRSSCSTCIRGQVRANFAAGRLRTGCCARPADLAGADAAHNAAALRAGTRGSGPVGAHRDALLLSAALALEVMTPQMSPRAAVARASYAIDQWRRGLLLARSERFGMRRS
jgi:anthranilate phosphoribosyltransferase